MRVCIISEGGYPVARGGLGEWAHNLINHLTDVEFDILCVSGKDQQPVWDKLTNIRQRIIIPLSFATYRNTAIPSGKSSLNLGTFLSQILESRAIDINSILGVILKQPLSRKWLLSKDYWNFLTKYYHHNCREVPFTEYYWTVLGLHSIVLDTLNTVHRLPQADIYHALSVGFAGFIGSIAGTLYRKPLILTEQGIYLKERRSDLQRQDVSEWYRKQLTGFSESMVKTSYRYADVVVPPCRSHMNIEKEYGLDLCKVRVIPNGLDCNHFVPAISKNGDVPLVGCFARVVPVKALEVFIRAAKKLCESQEVNFVVAGEVQDQEYYQECLALVKELGISEQLKFIGHTDSLSWLHKVDVFSLSSDSEGVPYALLEAMSCGLPAVCTAVGGVPEIIREDTGFLVPPRQPEALAARIGELLNNAQLRKQMGKRAREVALENYTISLMAHNFHDLYQELSNGRK